METLESSDSLKVSPFPTKPPTLISLDMEKIDFGRIGTSLWKWHTTSSATAEDDEYLGSRRKKDCSFDRVRHRSIERLDFMVWVEKKLGF